MSRRWVLWSGGVLLAALLAWSGWRLSIAIPGKLRGVEAEIAASAAKFGLDVRHGGLKLHLLHLYLSLDDLVVRDALADRFLARAGNLEISVSPLRLLKGELPVSRIRVRNFQVEAGEWNRALYEKLSSSEGGGDFRLPEILFVDGSVSLGPLGPVRRMDAEVQEIRVRQGRFLGTRIHAVVSRAAGRISIPGEGVAAWPFASVEADLVQKGDVIKVRRLRAWGDASAVRFSGFLETGKRLLEGKASGTIDLARWIASVYPGSSFARSTLRRGEIEFSASVSGQYDNPSAQARISMKKGEFRGIAVSDVEAALSSGGRVVRLDSARAKLLGGSFDAAGRYEPDTTRMELKASMSRISLSSVPWSDLGVPVRLSGNASLEASVSGTTDRLKAVSSLSLPDGVERLPAQGRDGYRFRQPVTLDAEVELAAGRVLRLESVRLRAGRAEARAEGEILAAARTLRLRGTVQAPSGKAEEYGLPYPVSWKNLEADWELSGPFSRLRTTASADVEGLAAWSLPPVPATATVEGVLTETLRFAAGVPAEPFNATAVGTVAFPMEPARTRANISVSARDIDLSESGRWASAVLASLGKDPGTVREYLAGTSGTAEADARIGIAAGAIDIRGSVRSARIDVRGIPIAAIKAAGEYGTTDGGARWAARGEGKFGAGAVTVAAEGPAGGKAEATARVSGLRISQALSLLKVDDLKRIDGVVDARIDVKQGAAGWEVPRLTVESRELAIGDAGIADVRVEGALGADAGTFTVRSGSPKASLSGEVRRGGEWRTGFTLSASALPTSFLLAAAGRPGVAAEGSWNADAQGVVHLAGLFEGRPVSPETFPALRASVHADGPGSGAIRFQEVRVTGARQGDGIAGELVTDGPETRLAWELSLREPFDFRLQGPFSIGEALNGRPMDEKRRVSIRGSTRITGALRAPERARGIVRIDSVVYREGGWELSGRNLAAAMDTEGIRWEEGTLTAAGTPVRISGKASWGGDIDARIDGKLPAGLVRLVVPGVFEKLDGIVTAEVRVTGTVSDPVIVGTGRLEGGTLLFKGYAQQFEGLKGEAVLSREKVVFEHFEGRSGGGYIDGWGEVPLQVDAGQRLYFSVDFFDMRYPYPEDVRPVVQGHVELFGPVDDLVVTGDVEVQSARYTKNVYPERALLDFRRRMADVSARKESTDFRVRLDIDVIADRTLRIKNNLADASGSGDFKVQGNTDKVIILGSFDVYEGYVEYYGNKYELKRAILDFQDPRKINPRLDIRAETRKGSYQIAVLVSGTLDKPEVDFSSDPPLGHTDIVSLLSFGVTTQTLLSPGYRSTPGSVGAGTVSGAAIAIGSIGGVDEQIRGAVGLDKFSIETGFSPTTQTFEPRLVARKSFEDRLSVTMSQSLGTTSETAASGEVRLHENVYLEGGWESSTTTTSGQISGDLKLRYRFQSLKDLLNGRD